MSVSPRIAIADTCFIIDWARYRNREIIFRVFDIVFIPEAVLREIKSGTTITWVARGLASGKLSLYTESEDEVEEARSLIIRSRRISHMIPVDLPEALCIVIGRRKGYTVLTENKGAIMATDIFDEYRGVIVWKALEILLTAQLEGVLSAGCNDSSKVFKEYEEDTLHIFPRRDLIEAVNRIEQEICRQRGART